MFQGLSAFPITPADRNGRVDQQAFGAIISRLAGTGIDSIGVLGSTGSYMYLTQDERRRALEAAIASNGGAKPIIAGVGALRTDAAVSLAREAKSLGIDAGLLSPVTYTPLTDEEVYRHFATVTEESELPIVIYDNPGTTHFAFKPELVARLAALPGIVGIKNPTSTRKENMAHLAHQRSIVPDDFSIGYSGDASCTECMIAGADTWYSVLAGVLPDICVKIVKAAKSGDRLEARRLDEALFPLWSLFRQHSSYRVVYLLNQLMGLCQAEPPLPMMPITGAAQDDVVKVFKNLPAEMRS